MLVFFALLLLGFAFYMALAPSRFSDRIVVFSRWRYFHLFEISSRLGIGALVLFVANTARFPLVFMFIGGVFTLAGIGLALTPPSKHRQFAEWSAQCFRPWFRPIGLLTIPFAVFLIYASIR